MPFDVRVIDVAVGPPEDGPAFSSNSDFRPQGPLMTVPGANPSYWATAFVSSGGDPIEAGFEWAAGIVLTGPDDDPAFGVDKLKLGFVQNVTVVAYEATFIENATTLINAIVPVEGAPQPFLDCADTEAAPWYTNDELAWLSAPVGDRSITIVSRDSPGRVFPIYSDLGSMPVVSNDRIDRCAATLEFYLWVVASPISDNSDNDEVLEHVSRQSWVRWELLGSDVEMPAGTWDQLPMGYSRVVAPFEWNPMTLLDLATQSFRINGLTANEFGQTLGVWR